MKYLIALVAASLWAQAPTPSPIAGGAGGGGGGGSVTGVTASSPLASSGGSAPNITLSLTNFVQNNQANTYGAFLQNLSASGLVAPSGGTNPATCAVGQVFFNTAATAGQNWYFCTATNTWTQQLNSGGGTSIPNTPYNSATPFVVGYNSGSNFLIQMALGSVSLTDYYSLGHTVSFANLPVASMVPGATSGTPVVYVVYDCLTTACTAGSGTILGYLSSDGTAWSVVNTTPAGGGGINVKAAPYYASGSITTTTTSGTTSPGTSVTLAAAIDFANNEGIYIPGAGALNSVGGTITRSAGGTATGTGLCFVDATNGTGGSGARGTIPVTSGSFAGATVTITSPGYNYTGLPTTWAVTLDTATTCSGTITTTGGALVASPYVGTVTAGGSTTTLTITPATTTSVSSGTVVSHDDSAAIQAAVTAAGTAGYGSILFPVGVYNANNCLATNSSVVSFPTIIQNPNYVTTPIVQIMLHGDIDGGWLPSGTSNNSAPIIQTTCSAGNLFGLQASGIGGSGFSAVEPAIDKLILRSYTNPSVTMWGVATAAQSYGGTVRIDTGSIPTVAPTNANGIGVITTGPFNTNENLWENVYIAGYFEAFRAGSHTDLKHFWSWFNWYALTIDDNNTGLDHPIYVDWLDTEQDKFLLSPNIGTSVNQYVYVQHWQVEQDSGVATGISWMSPATACNDAGNFLHGHVYYESDQGGFTKSGCKSIAVDPLDFNGQATQITSLGTTAGTVGFTAENLNTAGFTYFHFNDATGTSAGVIGYNNSGASPASVFQLGPNGSSDNMNFITTASSTVRGTITSAGLFEWGSAQQFQVSTGGAVSTTASASAATYLSATNCSSSASPAVCGSAAAGSFTVAASATTEVVDTSAVTLNSQIFVQEDSSLGTKLGVTCNTGDTIAVDAPKVTARSAATSFTVTVTGTVTTNPACYSYFIVN